MTPATASSPRLSTPVFLPVLTALALAAVLMGAAPPAKANTDTGSCPREVPSAGFSDIRGNTHERAIDCVVWWEIARGLTADRYSPARSVTREQMASFIARLLDATTGTLPEAGGRAFEDVQGVHATAVERLAAAGIAHGTTSTTFSPGRAVTREQMATFLVRAQEHASGEPMTAGRVPFQDVGTGPHAVNVAKAVEAGLTVGITATSFKPRGGVRRDQMASFVSRSLDRLAKDPKPVVEPVPAPVEGPVPAPVVEPVPAPVVEPVPVPVEPDPAPVEDEVPPPNPVTTAVVLRSDSNAQAQAKIDAAGPGAVISYETGVHAGRSVTPMPGQVHQGAADGGTVFDGSVAITGWTQSGSTWTATVPGGISDQRPVRDSRYGDVAAQRPEELFRNGTRDRRVETLAEVPAGASPTENFRAGKWWLDYVNDRVHVGTSPAGHSFRLSVTPQAIHAIPHPVTVRHLTARQYATQLRRGPLGGGFGLADWSTRNKNWTWENVVSEDNHGSGFVAALGGTLRGVKALRNGQSGVLAIGSQHLVDYDDPVDGGRSSRGAGELADIVIENSELAHNGQARHDFLWEGGGAKITQVTNPRSATVRNNHIHHNRVVGLWFDVYCETTLTESNLIERNEYIGMMHEISRGPGIMRDNLVQHNGDGTVKDISSGSASTFPARTGAWIAQSRDITLERNVFRRNHRMALYLQDRGTDWPPHLGNVRVLGNHFDGAGDSFHSWEGALQGSLADLTRLRTSSADRNQYWNTTGAWNPWSYGHWQQTNWQEFHKSFLQWQALGLDVNGALRTDSYQNPAGFRPYQRP